MKSVFFQFKIEPTFELSQMEISLDADNDKFLPTDLRHPDRLWLVRHLQLDVRQAGRVAEIHLQN